MRGRSRVAEPVEAYYDDLGGFGPDEAEGLATELLAVEHPMRLAHTVGVVRAAELLAARQSLGTHHTRTLISAAWLHDIGHSSKVGQETGLHFIDGARYLDRQGVYPELVSLVAWHSTASWEAAAAEQKIGYPDPRTGGDLKPVMWKALFLADFSTGPDGLPMTPRERYQDIVQRHPEGSPMVKALERAWPTLVGIYYQYHREAHRTHLGMTL